MKEKQRGVKFLASSKNIIDMYMREECMHVCLNPAPLGKYNFGLKVHFSIEVNC